MERNFRECAETVREGYQVNRKRNNVASALGVGMIFLAFTQEDIRKAIALDVASSITFIAVTIDSVIEGREILRKRNKNE